jgi:predicted nucleic acid-binding protein
VSVETKVLYVAEPPPQYLVRPPTVIDCSVFAALAFQEPNQAQAIESMRGKSLHAPNLLEVEMASVALKKLEEGFNDLAGEGLRQFEQADIMFYPSGSSAVLELAAQYRLSAYDAAYLQLAADLKCPLLTFDKRLGDAAKIHLATLL